MSLFCYLICSIVEPVTFDGKTPVPEFRLGGYRALYPPYFLLQEPDREIKFADRDYYTRGSSDVETQQRMNRFREWLIAGSNNNLNVNNNINEKTKSSVLSNNLSNFQSPSTNRVQEYARQLRLWDGESLSQHDIEVINRYNAYLQKLLFSGQKI